MSLKRIIPPTYAILCDAPEGCPSAIRDDSEWYVRVRAAAAGWQLRPRSGKGSRTAPDLCPEHREQTEGGDAR